MKKGFIFLSAGILLATALIAAAPGTAHAVSVRQNYCPIVLVNAALAWGRDELFGFLAWGGNECDIQEELKAQGYMTYTAAVGPFSSSWDRACELYAQIKGGTVDYGLAHSRASNHARYGRTYPGLYPAWGTIDPATGKPRKVHLVGHCFGGLTVRFIAQMLGKGVAEEIAATPPGELSPLFSGGHSWILSCTSIVTPHDGTSILDESIVKMFAATDLMKKIFLILGPGLSLDDVFDYDVKMDQWGFYAKPGESMTAIMNRMVSSGILNSRDFCNWDMEANSICRINSWVKAQPDVYYFSQAADNTYADILGFRHPQASMLFVDWPMAEIIGAHVRYTGPYIIDWRWFKNDGSVNTISMSGPKINSTDVIVNFDGVPKIGKWNFLGVMKGIDHYDLIGVNLGWYPYDPMPWWFNHAAVLGSLPL